MRQEIELTVSIDETNLIFEALGNLPFARVYALVAKLQTQAREQLGRAAPLEPVAEGARAPEVRAAASTAENAGAARAPSSAEAASGVKADAN